MFLLAALNVESLRSFAEVLREMLYDDILADGTTWSIVLRMGLKLESPNWVYSVLDVMNSRRITLDHDGLQAMFIVLKGIISSAELKEYYLRHFSEEEVVPFKPLHVVLQALCEDGKMDEALELVVEISKKHIPVEATLHLFIRMCKLNNDYEGVWKLIHHFRRQWKVSPRAKGIAALFDFACERQEFSDAKLIWEWAKSQTERWKMERRMIYKARDFEKEYGMRFHSDRVEEKEVVDAWNATINGERNLDPYHRFRERTKFHLKMMKARKDSEKLGDSDDIPDDVQFWKELEKTYDEAVAAGVWKPWDHPQAKPVHHYRRKYVKEGGKVKRVPLEMSARRVDSGLNFMLREMFTVWKKMQKGELKLKIN